MKPRETQIYGIFPVVYCAPHDNDVIHHISFEWRTYLLSLEVRLLEIYLKNCKNQLSWYVCIVLKIKFNSFLSNFDFLVKWQAAEFKKLPVIAFKFNFKENGRPDHAKKKLNNISDHKLYFHRTFQISTNPPSKR